MTTAQQRAAVEVRSPAAARDTLRTDTALLVLTFVAGVTDAVSFFGLGGVFTANMTGNLVLVGMAGASGAGWEETLRGDVLRCAASFAGFTLGMLGGFRLLRAGRRRETAAGRGAGPVTTVLGCALALHLAFLAGWVATGAGPGAVAGAGLIFVSATAMGVQTAAARGLDRAGITTTFVTGTLTALVSGLAAGDRKHAGLRCAVLGALTAGGLAGGLLLAWSPVAAGVVGPVATGVVLAVVRRRS